MEMSECSETRLLVSPGTEASFSYESLAFEVFVSLTISSPRGDFTQQPMLSDAIHCTTVQDELAKSGTLYLSI